jgi:ubiquinone/menaquinone biosynthesis C-methylase UbiE
MMASDSFKYILSKWVYGYHWCIEAVRRLQLKEGSQLLWIGSGTGKLALLVAKRFKCSIIGCDIDPFFIERANRRAESENQADTVKFILLGNKASDLDVEADAILFESILGFMKNPADMLRHYAERIRESGRIGVIELIFPDYESEARMMPGLTSIFGTDACFRSDAVWQNMFDEVGMRKIEAAQKPVGLFTKFWDDLREVPLGTVIDLSKTLYKSYTDSRAGGSMRAFRRFFKDYSNMVCSSYYILEPIRRST